MFPSGRRASYHAVVSDRRKSVGALVSCVRRSRRVESDAEISPPRATTASHKAASTTPNRTQRNCFILLYCNFHLSFNHCIFTLLCVLYVSFYCTNPAFGCYISINFFYKLLLLTRTKVRFGSVELRRCELGLNGRLTEGLADGATGC